MVRTQVQLSEAQAVALRLLASQRGVSMSQVIRQALEEVLSTSAAEQDKWARASSIIGKYHDPATDVAEDHDRYLADSYSS